jgi:hypothetical protein
MELSMRVPLIGCQFEMLCSRWFVLRNSVAGRQHEAAIQLACRMPLIRRQLLTLTSRCNSIALAKEPSISEMCKNLSAIS